MLVYSKTQSRQKKKKRPGVVENDKVTLIYLNILMSLKYMTTANSQKEIKIIGKR